MKTEAIVAALPAGLAEASANAQWLSGHPELARDYAGCWLCIVGERILVAEADKHAFEKKARRYADREGVYILRVPTTDELSAAHPL